MATTAPAHPLIDIKGLNHYYGPPPDGHLVLEDVNLTIRHNEVVGLLGRSGSGKSTLLRSIAGLIHPREGSVERVASQNCPAPSVAMVFQTFALFPWLTVQQNVELGLEAQKVPAEERRSRALAAIDLIGLDGFENAYPKELSGGMATLHAHMNLLVDVTARLHKARVRMVAGTDAAAYRLVGFSLHQELADLVRAGLSPLEALQTATLNPAIAFDRIADLGPLAPGKLADMVLLRGNPLQNIDNTRNIVAVISAGHLYDPSKRARLMQGSATLAARR